MERRVLTDNDIKERKRVLNGNLSEVFEVILEPNNEYWYEKFARWESSRTKSEKTALIHMI